MLTRFVTGDIWLSERPAAELVQELITLRRQRRDEEWNALVRHFIDMMRKVVRRFVCDEKDDEFIDVTGITEESFEPDFRKAMQRKKGAPERKCYAVSLDILYANGKTKPMVLNQFLGDGEWCARKHVHVKPFRYTRLALEEAMNRYKSPSGRVSFSRVLVDLKACVVVAVVLSSEIGSAAATWIAYAVIIAAAIVDWSCCLLRFHRVTTHRLTRLCASFSHTVHIITVLRQT